jgi:hypothetical protein
MTPAAETAGRDLRRPRDYQGRAMADGRAAGAGRMRRKRPPRFRDTAMEW